MITTTTMTAIHDEDHGDHDDAQDTMDTDPHFFTDPARMAVVVMPSLTS
jgi:ABC-type Zn uptake system ZnuABC Zn-binding protein ZnuA